MENYSNEIYYNENGIDYDALYANIIAETEREQQALEQQSIIAQQQEQDMLDSVTAITGIITLVMFVTILIASLISTISYWKIYKKANKPGWASIIPIYSNIVMLEICGLPVWMIILAMFVPPVYLILVGINLAKKFNKSTGFAIGLILLPLIFYPILAFGKNQYEGVSNNDDLPNNNNINNNMNNNNINQVNQNNNEVVNNQESLSNELRFGPQINNTEVNMQPNLGINSNQLNQNINSNLQNNVEQVTTMSAIMGMENSNLNVSNEIQQDDNIELPTVNPVNLETNTMVNNVNQESFSTENNIVNPISINESLNLNNTEVNNVNADINNIEQNTNVLENINYNTEVADSNINQTVVTEEPIINEVNIQMPEVNNVFPDNNVNEVNNIEDTPVNIPVVENNVVNEPISIPIEENNTNVEVVEEKPLSFNNLTENQEMLEKTSVLPNLSQININEVNTSIDNSPVMEPKPIALSDIVTENNNDQNNNSNIGFGDLTSKSCPNCGAKCTAGDMFCVNCGSKLN